MSRTRRLEVCRLLDVIVCHRMCCYKRLELDELAYSRAFGSPVYWAISFERFH